MEENSQEISAKMRKRKWICFGIVTAVVVALVGVCVGMSYVFDKNGVTNDHNTGIVWLAIAGTLLGCYALFVSVHTLSYYNTVPIKILKTVLRIGALILMIVVNILPLLVVLLLETTETNPWVIGLFGTGYLCAAISSLTFYWNERIKKAPRGMDQADYLKANITKIERAMTFTKGYPYVPFASLLIGYLLSVVFAYLGIYVHSFFYAGFGVVLCAIAVIISIVVFVKKFRRYRERMIDHSSGSGYTSGAVSYNTDRKADEGHKAGYRRMSSVVNGCNSLLPYSLPGGVSRVEWSKAANIVNYNNWAGRDSIIFGGRIKCYIYKEQRDYADDLCKRVLDDVKDNICRETEQILDELRSEFSNYGNYKVKFSLEYAYSLV